MPGQKTGHPFQWADYVAWLVHTEGSLTAVADKLAQSRGYAEDRESVERALRRLRSKESGDGGVWGHRVLKRFGMPQALQARLRWMAHYHSRFTDLPVPIALDLLRTWDRPPLTESRHRVWLHLGFASVLLRMDDPDGARLRLDKAGRIADAPTTAVAERLLIEAFVDSRVDVEATRKKLDEAGQIIPDLPQNLDAACLFARWIDQRGYELNVRQKDHEAAFALYETIPIGGSGFAMVRRNNGLGWSALKLGRRDEAREFAQESMRFAGDSGSLRLRAMALRLMARASEGEERSTYQQRAEDIAAELEDVALLKRFGGGQRPSTDKEGSSSR